MLLDGETFDLVQHVDTVLAAAVGHELEARINPELMQSVLEIATPVCRNAGDVEHGCASSARTSASRQGTRACASARQTHPFSLFER